MKAPSILLCAALSFHGAFAGPGADGHGRPARVAPSYINALPEIIWPDLIVNVAGEASETNPANEDSEEDIDMKMERIEQRCMTKFLQMLPRRYKFVTSRTELDDFFDESKFWQEIKPKRNDQSDSLAEKCIDGQVDAGTAEEADVIGMEAPCDERQRGSELHAMGDSQKEEDQIGYQVLAAIKSTLIMHDYSSADYGMDFGEFVNGKIQEVINQYYGGQRGKDEIPPASLNSMLREMDGAFIVNDLFPGQRVEGNQNQFRDAVELLVSGYVWDLATRFHGNLPWLPRLFLVMERVMGSAVKHNRFAVGVRIFTERLQGTIYFGSCYPVNHIRTEVGRILKIFRDNFSASKIFQTIMIQTQERCRHAITGLKKACEFIDPLTAPLSQGISVSDIIDGAYNTLDAIKNAPEHQIDNILMLIQMGRAHSGATVGDIKRALETLQYHQRHDPQAVEKQLGFIRTLTEQPTLSAEKVQQIMEKNLDVDTTIFLLRADVDKPGLNGQTPLCMAASYAAVDAVELLLQYGADPNAYCCDGYEQTRKTPLIMICGRRYPTNEDRGQKVFEMLLRSGAQPDLADENGFTPLMYAVVMRNRWAVQPLLDGGADVNRVGMRGLSAIAHAARFRDELMVAVLLAYIQRKGLPCVGCDIALAYAAAEGHLENMQTILAIDGELVNSDIGETHSDSGTAPENIPCVTPLFLAAEKDQLEAIQLLLEAGARDDICEKQEESALAVAKRLGHSEIVRALEQSATA